MCSDNSIGGGAARAGGGAGEFHQSTFRFKEGELSDVNGLRIRIDRASDDFVALRRLSVRGRARV